MVTNRYSSSTSIVVLSSPEKEFWANLESELGGSIWAAGYSTESRKRNNRDEGIVLTQKKTHVLSLNVLNCSLYAARTISECRDISLRDQSVVIKGVVNVYGKQIQFFCADITAFNTKFLYAISKGESRKNHSPPPRKKPRSRPSVESEAPGENNNFLTQLSFNQYADINGDDWLCTYNNPPSNESDAFSNSLEAEIQRLGSDAQSNFAGNFSDNYLREEGVGLNIESEMRRRSASTMSPGPDQLILRPPRRVDQQGFQVPMAIEDVIEQDVFSPRQQVLDKSVPRNKSGFKNKPNRIDPKIDSKDSLLPPLHVPSITSSYLLMKADCVRVASLLRNLKRTNSWEIKLKELEDAERTATTTMRRVTTAMIMPNRLSNNTSTRLSHVSSDFSHISEDNNNLDIMMMNDITEDSSDDKPHFTPDSDLLSEIGRIYMKSGEERLSSFPRPSDAYSISSSISLGSSKRVSTFSQTRGRFTDTLEVDATGSTSTIGPLKRCPKTTDNLLRLLEEQHKDKILFSSLCPCDRLFSRERAVAIFDDLLRLAAKGKITLIQKETFGDINVTVK